MDGLGSTTSLLLAWILGIEELGNDGLGKIHIVDPCAFGFGKTAGIGWTPYGTGRPAELGPTTAGFAAAFHGGVAPGYFGRRTDCLVGRFSSGSGLDDFAKMGPRIQGCRIDSLARRPDAFLFRRFHPFSQTDYRCALTPFSKA